MLGNLRDRVFGRHRRLVVRLREHGGAIALDQLGGVQRAVDKIIGTLARSEASAAAVVKGRAVPILRFHWVKNGDANAVAFEVGGTPHIALYGGTATLLAGCALAIARSADLWPDLPGGEVAARSYGPLAECFARRWPESRDTPIPSADRLYSPPDTPERIALASDLLWMSASFLFFHEAAHHRRGHVRRAIRSFGATEIIEADVNASVTSDPMILAFQAMEVDADASAVRLTLAASVDSHGHVAATDGLLPGRAVRLLLLSAGVLFNIFDYEQRGLGAFRSRRHPHPAIRLAAAVAEATAWACRRSLLLNEIEAAVVAGLGDLQRVADALGWTLTQVMRDEAAAVAANADALRAAAAKMDDECE